MATRATNKPAGRKVSDLEVKNGYHDEILNWLVDNLDDLVAEHTGINEEYGQKLAAKAKANFESVISGGVMPVIRRVLEEKELNIYRNRIAVDTNGISEFKALSGRLSSMLKAVPGIKFPTQFNDGFVEDYEVMKRVSHLELKPAKAQYRTGQIVEHPAGYVDLYASVGLPEEFNIFFDGLELLEMRFGEFSSLEDCMKRVDLMRPEKLSISRSTTITPYFFSVRVGPFTLGEVLQELKELKQLENKSQSVVLVVDVIDDYIRDKIERENFIVIARNDGL